ncbi:CBS domain containing-hemolysin-like protein [Lachnospiraceae bacterium PF1-21]|uniref:Hemolysin family protein n=1 Tax=Ohessyouella blattaphilus TaxID=2949333 RepID=A0ABT1EE84_9FIRM|nr:hemolysin family protein [Ohessyouella blattaphilus]MCP1109019.1 hemolysin family protein [Ohessyouella blattaphilus]MCR8562413.1 hemolysin family protein [Ohessyouella blattaphilus]MDL2249756.1 hemolysin family protein [Lachnospiraceae bacterium OttesenSCG-928-J05]
MIFVDSSSIPEIIALIILLALSAFFSSAETALTTSNKIRLRGLADEGNKKAKTVLKITDKPSKMLSAILIGNNIVNVGAASLTTTITYDFGGRWVALGSGIITLLILIFGEITPKTLASSNADSVSLVYAPIINLIIKILQPFVFLINAISQAILRLLGIDPNKRKDQMTENELRTMLHVSEEEGVIENEEKEMIYNVFDLGDAKAKDVMVPRVHVTFASIDATYDELIGIFKEDKFTRLPIYRDTTDNVVGTINMKDLLLYENKEHFHIEDILRDAYFTYEYKNISELLIEMRDSSFNIAIVLDEYGETSGLITLEDILEEIVGEIRDEYDEEEVDIIRKIGDREFITEGSINLDDLNDELNTHLESDDYDSLGGYIIQHLDRLPEAGDAITTPSGIRLVVDSLDKNRIDKVHIYLPEEEATED